MTNNSENEKKENSAEVKSNDAANGSANKTDDFFTKVREAVNQVLEMNIADELKQINRIRKETLEGAEHATIEKKMALLIEIIAKLNGMQLLLLLVPFLGLIWLAFISPTLITLVVVLLVCMKMYKSKSTQNKYLHIGLFLLVVCGVIFAGIASLMASPLSALSYLNEIAAMSVVGQISFWVGTGCIVFHFYKKSRPNHTTHIKCPDCKELVLKDATVCKHCGCRQISETATKAD